MTSRRFRPLVAACGLLVLWLALAVAVPCPAQGGPQGDWELTLEALRKQDQIVRSRVEAFKERQGADAARLAQDTEPLLREGARLSLWQATASDPWEIRDILAGFAKLRTDVTALLQRPEQQMEQLEQNIVILETFRERLAEALASGMPESLRQDVAASETAMAELRELLAGLRDAVATGATPLRELAARLAASQDRMQTALAPAWKDYYATTFTSIFSRDFKLIAQEDLEDWRLWAGFLADQFTTRRNADLLLRGAGGSLAAALLAALVLILANRLAARHGLPRPSRQVLVMAPACLVSGLFFVCMASLGPAFLFTIMNSIGEILWTATLVYLTRLRRAGADAPASPPILWPMWRLFALGILFEALRLPETALAPALALLFLAHAASFANKTKRTPREQRLDRAMTLALAGLLPLLAALSLFGRPQTAVLIASALFYIALALRFAATTMRFFHRMELSAPRPSFLMSILGGAGFPFYVLTYLFLFLWLLSSQYGGEGVFLELVAAEARFESVGISLKKAVTLLAGYYATRAAKAAAAAGIAGLSTRRQAMEPGVRASLLTINTYFWWGCFAILALSVLGLSLTNLAVVAGGLSVGIGFGLQNLVNNFIGGLILLFGRSVQAGDAIQLGDALGVVKEVNIRNTEVLTLDNATVFVPNAELVSGRITNWSHKDPSARREIAVGVAYGSDTAKVRALLLKAAASCPAVLANPAPTVLHWDFGPSALEFRLRVWIADLPGASTILSAIRTEIDRLFREAGIEIAFPQTEVHLRSAPALEALLNTHQAETRQRLAAIADRLSALEDTARAGRSGRGQAKDGPQ